MDAAAEAGRRVRMSRSEQEIALGDARTKMRALFASRLDDTQLKLVRIGDTFPAATRRCPCTRPHPQSTTNAHPAAENPVRKAFAGIGYSRTAADIQCP